MLPLQKFDNIPIRMVIGKSTEEYRWEEADNNIV